MTKYLLLILCSILFFSCNRKDNTENIELNGFKDLTSTYRFNILLSEGKGSEFITSNKNSLKFEIDLNISIHDSVKYESTISRLKYEYNKNPLFGYIFDTNSDTVAVKSDYMELEFNDNEKQKVDNALAILKNIRGKSFLITHNKEGELKMEKNDIQPKDYFLHSKYNPEEQITQIFEPSDLLTLYDFVFYPELGSYIKGKRYKIKNVNDSLNFVYQDDNSNEDVFYSEERFKANEYRKVESRIHSESGHVLESKYSEQIKKEKDILGMYKIFEKEVTIKQIN